MRRARGIEAEALCGDIMVSASRLMQALKARDRDVSGRELHELHLLQARLVDELAETRPSVILVLAHRLRAPLRNHSFELRQLAAAAQHLQSKLFPESHAESQGDHEHVL